MKICDLTWLCYFFSQLRIIDSTIEGTGDYCQHIEDMEDSKDTVIITGMSEKTEKADFNKHFSSIGPIYMSELRAEKREGIVTYEDATHAPKAVHLFNEKDFKGSCISVQMPEQFFKQNPINQRNLPNGVKNMAWHFWWLENGRGNDGKGGEGRSGQDGENGVGGMGGKGGSGGCFGSSGQDGENGVGGKGGKGGKGGSGGIFGWFQGNRQNEEPQQDGSNGGGQGGKGGAGWFGFFKGQDGQPGEAGPGGKGGKGGKGGSLL